MRDTITVVLLSFDFSISDSMKAHKKRDRKRKREKRGGKDTSYEFYDTSRHKHAYLSMLACCTIYSRPACKEDSQLYARARTSFRRKLAAFIGGCIAHRKSVAITIYDSAKRRKRKYVHASARILHCVCGENGSGGKDGACYRDSLFHDRTEKRSGRPMMRAEGGIRISVGAIEILSDEDQMFLSPFRPLIASQYHRFMSYLIWVKCYVTSCNIVTIK